MKKLILIIFLVFVSSVAAVEVYETDFNKDYKVDLDDVTEFLKDLGKTDNYNYRYDVKEDWKIDFYDLVMVAKNYGKTYPKQIKNYDVVVVGAGSGGIAAAIQAARLGADVALLEETDYIGGQLIAVPTMDEGTRITRDYGIYNEFANRIKSYYEARGKSMGTCYWNPDTICMEPHVARQILMQMINDEDIDLFLKTKVYDVLKSSNTVKGVITEDGKEFNSKVVIDATEYGDVIPLTGARYRVANSVSTDINPSCVQDITYTAIIKKYPNGVPGQLFMETPPPGYSEAKNYFKEVVTKDGSNWYTNWGSYPVNWITHTAYRGIPDSSNPNDYTASVTDASKITKTGVNWANDYPGNFIGSATLSLEYLEDPVYRRKINCEAKLKTLQFIYYTQHDLQQPLWSIANDEGFDTTYNIQKNSCPNIPEEYKEIEKHFPTVPYVRESRRIVPVDILTAEEIERIGNPPKAQESYKTSLAVGYYHDDLHNCKANEYLDTSLETMSDVPETWTIGPFQVPFEAFIPETIDGFLPAEKNIGVTRLVNGAIRLQPITMQTGQAVGIIAALSVKQNKQPRNINVLEVQKELVEVGSQLSLNIYTDVPTSHEYWKQIELISARELMSGYGDETFGPDNTLTRAEMAAVLGNLLDLDRSNPPETPTFQDVSKDKWYYKHVEAIYEVGITGGCSADPPLFCPQDPVTRAQMATFLVKALGHEKYTGTQQSFSDVSIDQWYHGWIEKANELGIMGGYGDGTFKPEQNMKRGEVAVALYNTLLYMNN